MSSKIQHIDFIESCIDDLIRFRLQDLFKEFLCSESVSFDITYIDRIVILVVYDDSDESVAQKKILFIMNPPKSFFTAYLCDISTSYNTIVDVERPLLEEAWEECKNVKNITPCLEKLLGDYFEMLKGLLKLRNRFL